MKWLWIIELHAKKSDLEAPDFSSDIVDVIPAESTTKRTTTEGFYVDFVYVLTW